MKSNSPPITAGPKSTGRRGGVRGTRGASGSPVVDASRIAFDRDGSDRSLLLEANEVGRILAIGRTKTYELIADGELPVVRIGRCIRVPRAALRDWIDSKTSMVERT